MNLPWTDLALHILAGPLEPEGVLRRVRAAVPANWPGATVFVHRFFEQFSEGSRPPLAAVEQFIRSKRSIVKMLLRRSPAGPPAPVMTPAAGAAKDWNLPCLTTVDDLARLVGTEPDKLEWLTAHGSTHYQYRWIPKRSGGQRLIENPMPLLKSVQRTIHRKILAHIPAHNAVHSFRAQRSIKSFAAPHARQDVVLRMDLLDFFPSVGRSRASAIFRTAGYPEEVATLLGSLCTAATPWPVIRKQDPPWWTRARLAEPHLPQGAPSSPALSNLAAFKIDRRLSALAKSLGANYTRYADDLAFSGDGDFRRGLDRFFIPLVGSIILEEGFAVNMRKNRVMTPASQQRLAGVVINDHPNTARKQRDRLRAILHNCRCHGPASQNREQHPEFAAHLRGRIAAVAMLDAAQGERLLNIFEQIDWSAA